MGWRKIFSHIRGRYVDPRYPFRDRLYFLFGTAGTLSAAAAFLAAVGSGLPAVAAVASLASFFIMLVLMVVSFLIRDVSTTRIVCSVFLNFFMFPVLFWVTGGVDCGMVFYFILGLCVATLILEGRTRLVVLALSMSFYLVCLYLGFRYPQYASHLSFEERCSDVLSSFLIVSLFIIAVIIIMSKEYQKEHDEVAAGAAALKRQAVTDSLTSLYNQRYLIDAMERTAAACGETGAAAALLLLDIDDFKKINDAYGHLRGNQVLCRLAVCLKSRVRECDVVARYGGEEFVVLLVGCGHEKALEIAEAIRAGVRGDGELQDLTEGRISISGGVAAYSPGIQVDEWVRRADVNMYAAKAAGKNRIVG